VKNEKKKKNELLEEFCRKLGKGMELSFRKGEKKLLVTRKLTKNGKI